MQFQAEAMVQTADALSVTVLAAVGNTPQVGLFVPPPAAGEQ